jgi:hypothetical protein
LRGASIGLPIPPTHVIFRVNLKHFQGEPRLEAALNGTMISVYETAQCPLQSGMRAAYRAARGALMSSQLIALLIFAVIAVNLGLIWTLFTVPTP